jgi:hypothetical protein
MTNQSCEHPYSPPGTKADLQQALDAQAANLTWMFAGASAGVRAGRLLPLTTGAPSFSMAQRERAG